MAGSLNITCLGSGQGTFFVDGGRPGFRNQGIALGGAADPAATNLMNRLIGQSPTHPCLETTLRGGEWLLSGKGQIVLGGASVAWKIDGSPVDRYSVLYVEGESILTGGPAAHGCRAYLAIRGDWILPRVLGSIEKGLPGVARLGKGSIFTVVADTEAEFSNDLAPPRHSNHLSLRAMSGPEWDRLTNEQKRWITEGNFTVSAQSNRQGIRLLDQTLPTISQSGLLSSPVLPGTVQLTPAGLILLGPDAQTVGGYPRVLQVDDYSAAFQLQPGGKLRFEVAGN